MNDFLSLPFKIYRDDPDWVAPLVSEVRRTLDVRKNPYFRNASLRLFLSYKDNDPIARVAIIINEHHQKKFSVKAAFFGFFESVNDAVVATVLFNDVEHYCREQNVELLEGPFNPNHYSELGLQVTEFGTLPTYFQTFNPDYYSTLLESVGFAVSKSIFTARNDNIKEYIKQHYESRNSLSRNGLTIRPFSIKNFNGELEKVREVFNDAFENNWHFLHVSRNEYLFTTKFLRHVTKPELLQIVEHKGEPVAVLMCLPDVNPLLKIFNGKIGPLKLLRFFFKRNQLKTLIVFAAGIKKRFQRTATHELLFNSLCKIAQQYDALETTWMSYDNPLAVRAAERFGMKENKRFAIYCKNLSDNTSTQL
jgi:hypothetical protein